MRSGGPPQRRLHQHDYGVRNVHTIQKRGCCPARAYAIDRALSRGSQMATKELVQIAPRLGIDVALVQEHYKAEDRSILDTGAGVKAAFILISKELTVTIIHHLSSSHCIVAHVVTKNTELYIVSAYFQFSEAIDGHLAHLERYLRLYGARHYTGSGSEATKRRKLLKNFIDANDFQLANVEGHPPTFSGPNGESYIDITLVTRSVNVANWKVLEGVSCSDHQLIMMEVSVGIISPRYHGCQQNEEPEGPMKYRYREVDWDRFQSVFHRRIGRIDLGTPAELACAQFS
ncbi:hypothetical protein O0L34_g19307 [Tuta absoluta]|nr:hypothetical protein O0L34_g19307 [Tuta absoluta]